VLALTNVELAETPFAVTVVVVWKPLPETVTVVPIAPDDGLTLQVRIRRLLRY
jgi:hypothetical protein